MCGYFVSVSRIITDIFIPVSYTHLVAATLVVTGAGFVSYQKVLFPKGNALSDVNTVPKLNYLEELIDTEYLDEKDESSLREGIYAGLLAGLKDPCLLYTSRCV